MNSKIIAGCVIAAIILAGILAGVLYSHIQRQNLISDALTFYNQGNYQETIDRLKPTIQGDARAADERLIVAESYYRLRDYDRAQEVLDPLLRAGQEDASALLLSGWLWVKENSPLQAQVRFEKAANLGKEAEAVGGMGAVALLRSEDYRSNFINDAETQLKKSISLDPTNPKVFLVLSELRRIQHQYDEAIDLTKKAVNLAPCWSEPYALLGRIYLLQDNHAEAEKCFTESQKYGGSKEETQYFLALSVYYQGRFTQALSLLDELIKTGKEKVRDALSDAARIALLMDNQKAMDSLKRAWAIKPDPSLGMQLFEIYIRMGKQEEALSILKETLTNWPFLSLGQLEMGNISLKQNDFDRAYSSYQGVLEQDGQNWWANYNLGYIAPIRNDINQAPDYFQAAAREYSDFFPAQVNLALGHLALDRAMDADNLLAELLSRYPDNSRLLLTRALERYAAGDSNAALDYLDKAQKNASNQAIVSVVRGDILLRLFQFEKSLTSFDEALRLDEKSLRALLGKAHALYRLGDFAKAEECYQQLFGVLSSLSSIQQTEVQNGLALAQLERNESQKSLEIWENLKRSDLELARQFALVNVGLMNEESPGNSLLEDIKAASLSRNPLPELYYNLAVFLLTLDRKPEAIESYENLIKRYPSYLPGLFNLANVYSVENRKGDAIALYDRASIAAPKRIDVLNNQAAAYAGSGRFDQAKERLEQADAVDASYAEIRYNRILVALREGKVEEAKKLANQIKSSGVSSALLDMAQGLVFMIENQWKEAESAFAQARKQEPQNAYACLNHGVSLAKLKKYSEAQVSLREAIQCDPSLAEARRVLGLLYCELGLFDLAEKELKAALQLDPSQTDLDAILEQIYKWIAEINPSNP